MSADPNEAYIVQMYLDEEINLFNQSDMVGVATCVGVVSIYVYIIATITYYVLTTPLYN